MVDVVLPFYNAPALLGRCLGALEHALAPDGGVILVDDASEAAATRLAEDWAAARPHRARYTRHPANRGFRESACTGIALSDAPRFLLLNSDTVPPPALLERLTDAMDRRPPCAFAAPVSNTPADLFQYREDCAWRSGPLGGHLHRASLERARTQAGRVTDAPYLTAACLLVDRRAFEDAGGFSTAYAHGYFEDLDLCCRARQMGYRLAIREDCLVYHEGRGSYAGMTPSRRDALIRRNFQTFCARWGHLPEHAALLERLEAAGRAALGEPA